MPPVVLTMAGYDPSSGAGVTADVKTAAAQGCYAVTCITALTVQSSQGVFEVRPLEPDLVRRTLTTLAQDLDIAAVRVGMLGSEEVVSVVSKTLVELGLPNIVVDPVLRSSSGADLLHKSGLQALREDLLPLSDVITPNVEEAAALAETQAPTGPQTWEDILPWMRTTASKLRSMGSRAIVITDGHLTDANDHLLCPKPGGKGGGFDSQPYSVHLNPRDGLCLCHGHRLPVGARAEVPLAVRAAKGYVRRTIQAAYPLDGGIGPIHHMV